MSLTPLPRLDLPPAAQGEWLASSALENSLAQRLPETKFQILFFVLEEVVTEKAPLEKRKNWAFGNGIAQYADAPPPHLAKG